MEYSDIREIVDRVVYDRMKEISDVKKCPRCGKITTMLKLYVEMEEEDIVRWRCLNCLGLFKEEFKEIEKLV